eukprot:m51a1_g9128 putative protein serine threonine (1033) ;mRNA; r:5552-9038
MAGVPRRALPSRALHAILLALVVTLHNRVARSDHDVPWTSPIWERAFGLLTSVDDANAGLQRSCASAYNRSASTGVLYTATMWVSGPWVSRIAARTVAADGTLRECDPFCFAIAPAGNATLVAPRAVRPWQAFAVPRGSHWAYVVASAGAAGLAVDWYVDNASGSADLAWPDAPAPAFLAGLEDPGTRIGLRASVDGPEPCAGPVSESSAGASVGYLLVRPLSATIPKCRYYSAASACGLCAPGYYLSSPSSCVPARCANVTYATPECVRCDLLPSRAGCEYNAECQWCAAETACKPREFGCGRGCSGLSREFCWRTASCSWQDYWHKDQYFWGSCVNPSQYADCRLYASRAACDRRSPPCSWCNRTGRCNYVAGMCNACAGRGRAACGGGGQCAWCESFGECVSLRPEEGNVVCPRCSDYASRRECGSPMHGGCAWCSRDSLCTTVQNYSAACDCSKMGPEECSAGVGNCKWCQSTAACSEAQDCMPCDSFSANASECNAMDGCEVFGGGCIVRGSLYCELLESLQECAGTKSCSWCNGVCSAASKCRASVSSLSSAPGGGAGDVFPVAAAIVLFSGVALFTVLAAVFFVLRSRQLSGGRAVSCNENAGVALADMTSVTIPGVLTMSPAEALASLGVRVTPSAIGKELCGGMPVDRKTEFAISVRRDTRRLARRGSSLSAMQFDASFSVTAPPGAESAYAVAVESPRERVALEAGAAVECRVSVVPKCSTTVEASIVARLYSRCTGADVACVVVPMTVVSERTNKIDARELVPHEIIGEGTYGRVYRGTWKGIEVAIKEFTITSTSWMCVADFEAEVNAHARLRTPLIVTFYGLSRSSSNYWIVMELAPMGGLGSWLQTHDTPIAPRVQIAIALDCARGMALMHANGFIHRDLKPDNLLLFSLELTAEVRVKISDFGTARMIGHQTDPSAEYTKAVGSPLFMAPEVILNQAYGPSVDVYAFGLTLWTLATRQAPFSGRICVALQEVPMGSRPPLPVGHPLSHIMEACWQQSQAARPCFSDVIKELERLYRV